MEAVFSGILFSAIGHVVSPILIPAETGTDLIMN